MMKHCPRLSPLLVSVFCLAACAAPDPQEGHIGYVEANWLYIAAPQAGWVIEQSVQEGDEISEGDLLFRLDAVTEQAALAEAQARFNQTQAEARNIETGARAPELAALRARRAEAEAQLLRVVSDRNRILPLVEAGVEPAARRDQLIADADAAMAAVEALNQDIAVAEQAGRPAARDAAEAMTNSAAASLDRARYRLEQRQIIATVSGRVERVLLTAGEYALPGTHVLAVQPSDGLKIRFFVPQASLPELAIGETVKVTSDGSAASEAATISYISTSAEFTPPVIYSRNTRDKLVFLVEADLPAGSRLLPGLPVEVDW